MTSWDEEHRLRLRAERISMLLQRLWGDQPPPGHNGELITLIDAIAGDDDHGHRDHLVCQVDGLTFEALAHLLHLARSIQSSTATSAAMSGVPTLPSWRDVDVSGLVPSPLLARLHALGLLDDLDSLRLKEAARAPDLGMSSDAGLRNSDVQNLSFTAGPTTFRSAADTLGLGRGVEATTTTGVWELDPATGIVIFDDVAAQLIGAGTTAGSDLLDSHLQDLIHPDDRHSVASGMQECLRSGVLFLCRFRVYSPGETVKWRISQGRVVHNPSDGSARLAGFITPDYESPQAVPTGALHGH
ncbi:PAS domain-containing protein [Kineococcus rubinsiae]|uniref:PAS domain-containing protein n=1 Tax=Kineococcus rubinsiae TaxID=2609562 RepID=UPI001430D327|nr:PAS domain-containing protein [Kineococcus rubinsiae]NIZ90353.1 PAS domain-containing protein [Kineococcus rubinsiae]